MRGPQCANRASHPATLLLLLLLLSTPAQQHARTRLGARSAAAAAAPAARRPPSLSLPSSSCCHLRATRTPAQPITRPARSTLQQVLQLLLPQLQAPMQREAPQGACGRGLGLQAPSSQGGEGVGVLNGGSAAATTALATPGTPAASKNAAAG